MSCTRLLTLIALFGCMISCADLQSAASGSNQETDSDASQPVSDAGQKMSIDEQVLFAKQALAERLQIEMEDIKAETVRIVNWRSGAAGCPRPGMSYTMAIVPGVLILLNADGSAHHYHAGLGRAPFYCPAERVEAPAYGLGEEAM